MTPLGVTFRQSWGDLLRGEGRPLDSEEKGGGSPPPFPPRAQPDLYPRDSITLIFCQCGYIAFSPPLRLGTVARTCDRGVVHRNAVGIPDHHRFPQRGVGIHPPFRSCHPDLGFRVEGLGFRV